MSSVASRKTQSQDANLAIAIYSSSIYIGAASNVWFMDSYVWLTYMFYIIQQYVIGTAE